MRCIEGDVVPDRKTQIPGYIIGQTGTFRKLFLYMQVLVSHENNM